MADGYEARLASRATAPRGEAQPVRHRRWLSPHLFITGSEGDIAALELRHHGHARVEDRVRSWTDLGLANLAFEAVVANMAWVQVSLVAGALLAWAQMTALDGALAKAEPKTLPYSVLHVAALLVRPGGRLVLRLDRTWPWADDLAAAFSRLRATSPEDPGSGACPIEAAPQGVTTTGNRQYGAPSRSSGGQGAGFGCNPGVRPIRRRDRGPEE